MQKKHKIDWRMGTTKQWLHQTHRERHPPLGSRKVIALPHLEEKNIWNFNSSCCDGLSTWWWIGGWKSGRPSVLFLLSTLMMRRVSCLSGSLTCNFFSFSDLPRGIIILVIIHSRAEQSSSHILFYFLGAKGKRKTSAKKARRFVPLASCTFFFFSESAIFSFSLSLPSRHLFFYFVWNPTFYELVQPNRFQLGHRIIRFSLFLFRNLG